MSRSSRGRSVKNQYQGRWTLDLNNVEQNPLNYIAALAAFDSIIVLRPRNHRSNNRGMERAPLPLPLLSRRLGAASAADMLMEMPVSPRRQRAADALNQARASHRAGLPAMHINMAAHAGCPRAIPEQHQST
eukprot:scaffold92929_cov36-Tisochrysis_lutea.AAC.1